MATYGTTDRLTGGTPTGTSGGTIANAVDNNVSTYWAPTGAVPIYFKYDCGVGVNWAFSKLRAYNYLDQGINAFNVTLSNDDSNWTTVYSGNMANNENWQDFTWTNRTKYRYININITSDYYPGSLAVYEFEAFEGIYPAGGLGIGNPYIF